VAAPLSEFYAFGKAARSICRIAGASEIGEPRVQSNGGSVLARVIAGARSETK